MTPPRLSQLGQIFVSFINRMAEFFREILKNAAILKKMELNGELSENWQDFLAEAVGIKEEQVVDQKTREVVREIDPELVPFSVREEGGSGIGDSSTQFSIREDLSKVTEEQETQAMQDAEILRVHDEEGKPLPAPNGKSSNLTRDQWITVRTPLFKRWFGDWEALSRINQVRSLQAFDATNTKPVADQAEAKDVFKGFGDNVTNALDGRRVRFPSSVAGKILRHKGFDSAAIVQVLDKVFEQSIPAWSEKEILRDGHKPHKNVEKYHHYVGRIRHGVNDFLFGSLLQRW